MWRVFADPKDGQLSLHTEPKPNKKVVTVLHNVQNAQLLSTQLQTQLLLPSRPFSSKLEADGDQRELLRTFLSQFPTQIIGLRQPLKVSPLHQFVCSQGGCDWIYCMGCGGERRREIEWLSSEKDGKGNEIGYGEMGMSGGNESGVTVAVVVPLDEGLNTFGMLAKCCYNGAKVKSVRRPISLQVKRQSKAANRQRLAKKLLERARLNTAHLPKPSPAQKQTVTQQKVIPRRVLEDYSDEEDENGFENVPASSRITLVGNSGANVPEVITDDMISETVWKQNWLEKYDEMISNVLAPSQCFRWDVMVTLWLNGFPEKDAFLDALDFTINGEIASTNDLEEEDEVATDEEEEISHCESDNGEIFENFEDTDTSWHPQAQKPQEMPIPVHWTNEIQMLREMGFREVDTDVMVCCLDSLNGDVTAVVDALLEMQYRL
eukprot:c4858_g1_i1.p1 GENE.c4858_g1_i1~~c4858_g1_i1.p1  ORF type:complete len:434 (+),score=122.68 c4858_g1_i1:56-1357(+)